MNFLAQCWYQQHPIRFLLWPLSLIYRFVIKLRLYAYRYGLFKQHRLAVPVIIVGNLTVGGTGKTPFVIWLTNQLKHMGFRPGIISRGYGGNADSYPAEVTISSLPSSVGDEPILISRHTQCPMAVSPQRQQAAQLLIDNYDCDIIISDDGLQHYALARDIEIVIVDGQRQFGNQYCLPAGPLREPMTRLDSVDFIVYNSPSHEADNAMSLNQGRAINLANPDQTMSLAEFDHVHAVAGIGNPDRFFKQLQQHQMTLKTHSFPDHHKFSADDLQFDETLPILMTEKDAVKCQDFALDSMWYVPVEATIQGTLLDDINHKLAGIPTHG